jgi:hypothetical protein
VRGGPDPDAITLEGWRSVAAATFGSPTIEAP